MTLHLEILPHERSKKPRGSMLLGSTQTPTETMGYTVFADASQDENGSYVVLGVGGGKVMSARLNPDQLRQLTTHLQRLGAAL